MYLHGSVNKHEIENMYERDLKDWEEAISYSNEWRWLPGQGEAGGEVWRVWEEG